MKRMISLVLALALLISCMPLQARAAESYERIYGNTRYETSFAIADEMKRTLGIERFDAVIIASGTGFADALAGSYLAAKKNAPILLTNGGNGKELARYLSVNLTAGGTVYLLGGTAAVPERVEKELSGYQVKRLGGATRYETNLMILQEAGTARKDVFVCTGEGFADSLSISALGVPILLVKGSLTEKQKAFLAGNNGVKVIVGGTSAVSRKVEDQLKAYGTVIRVGGSNRYETSVMVAKTYFSVVDYAVAAYARNYPDGLCAGPLAHAIGCPLLLTETGREAAAAEYTAQKNITEGIVLGGPGLISDGAAKKIFPGSDKPKEKLVLEAEELFIKQGDVVPIGYFYDGDPSKLMWTSDDIHVATVDQKGVVTAKMGGIATIEVTDWVHTKKCTVYVKQVLPIPDAEEIRIVNSDAPFYDGITRRVGDYIQILASVRPYEANRDIKAVSSDPDIISVTKEGNPGGDAVYRLDFKKAGSATVTLSSGDGAVSQAYTITTVEGYSFDPGDKKLTPEEFASCATKILCEYGFTESDSGGWLLLVLSEEDLYFDKVVDIAGRYAHSWWGIRARYAKIVYIGQNEDGKYEFHACCG